MKTLAAIGIFATIFGVVAIPEANASPLYVDEANLAKYFTPAEIAQYEAIMGSMTKVARPTSDETNRLTDPVNNRCGDNMVPPQECPDMQNVAYNNGNGCINAKEYDFARANAIAPICHPLKPTVYIGWCRCGCFEKTTELLSFDAATGQGQLKNVTKVAIGDELYAMKDDATVDDPQLEPRPVTATTVGDEEKPLVWVHLENGKVLGLTEQHAVLLSTGEMIPAVALDSSAHQLVSRWGEFVSITSIERTTTPDPVYNVLTNAGLDHQGHIIVANDMMVGDIMWQNTLAADLWKVVVRM